MAEEGFALEGLTRIEGTDSGGYLYHLPKSLESLILGDKFDVTLQGVSLPNTLQNLTFGARFDQSLERVNLPRNLQTLTFGDMAILSHSLGLRCSYFLMVTIKRNSRFS